MFDDTSILVGWTNDDGQGFLTALTITEGAVDAHRSPDIHIGMCCRFGFNMVVKGRNVLVQDMESIFAVVDLDTGAKVDISYEEKGGEHGAFCAIDCPLDGLSDLSSFQFLSVVDLM